MRLSECELLAAKNASKRNSLHAKQQRRYSMIVTDILFLQHPPTIYSLTCTQSAEHYAELGHTHGDEFLPYGTVYQAAEKL